MKLAPLILLLLAVCVAGGCNSAAKKKARDAASTAKANEAHRYETVSLGQADQTLTDAEGDVDTALKDEADPVRKMRLTYIGKKIHTAHDHVRAADKQEKIQQTVITEITAQRDEARADLEKPLNVKLNALIIAGIVVFAGGMAVGAIGARLEIAPMKAGYDVGMFGALLVGSSMSVKAVGPYEKYAGMATVAMFIGYVAYRVWREIKRQRLADAKEAAEQKFTEVVDTVQKLKDDPTVPNEAIYKAAGDTQSAETTAKVREVIAAKKVDTAADVAADKKRADECDEEAGDAVLPVPP